jgi:hypothetical protein
MRRRVVVEAWISIGGVAAARTAEGLQAAKERGAHADRVAFQDPLSSEWQANVRAVGRWVQAGGTPQHREIRTRLPRLTEPARLLESGRPATPTPNTRGVVSCSSPKLLKQTLRMLTRLRRVGSSLPAEIWHVGELSRAQERQIREGRPGWSDSLASKCHTTGALTKEQMWYLRRALFS